MFWFGIVLASAGTAGGGVVAQAWVFDAVKDIVVPFVSVLTGAFIAFVASGKTRKATMKMEQAKLEIEKSKLRYGGQLEINAEINALLNALPSPLPSKFMPTEAEVKEIYEDYEDVATSVDPNKGIQMVNRLVSNQIEGEEQALQQMRQWKEEQRKVCDRAVVPEGGENPERIKYNNLCRRVNQRENTMIFLKDVQEKTDSFIVSAQAFDAKYRAILAHKNSIFISDGVEANLANLAFLLRMLMKEGWHNTTVEPKILSIRDEIRAAIRNEVNLTSGKPLA